MGRPIIEGSRCSNLGIGVAGVQSAVKAIWLDKGVATISMSGKEFYNTTIQLTLPLPYLRGHILSLFLPQIFLDPLIRAIKSYIVLARAYASVVLSVSPVLNALYFSQFAPLLGMLSEDSAAHQDHPPSSDMRGLKTR